MKSSSSVTTSEAHAPTPSAADESDLERVKQVAWGGSRRRGWELERGRRKERDMGPGSATDLPHDPREGLRNAQFSSVRREDTGSGQGRHRRHNPLI